MKKLMAIGIIGMLLCGGASLGFGQNLLTNGSFESPAIGAGNYAFYYQGDTMPGWTFGGGDGQAALVDTNFWPSQDGNQALFFNTEGTAPNLTLSQTFSTTASQQYQVTFYQWAANGVASGDMGFQVSANGTTILTTATQSSAPTQWTVDFTATGSSTTLQFADISVNSDADLALDNVAVVTAVPEPGTYAAIAGLLSLSLAALRRRRLRIAA
jgi:hypothetical protein